MRRGERAVPVAASVPLSEYLNTSYRPDCDYLEGELLERNVGEWDHARLQALLTVFFHGLEKRLGILVVPEQRVQVKARRFRVPDITVIVGPRPDGGIITKPPFLCIEILSPEDRLTQVRAKVADYLDFRVPYVWVVDPLTKLATVYTAEGGVEIRDGILTTQNPGITVNLHQLE
jgi:Uma2 family endonuclease